MFLENCKPQSSLKKAVRNPLEVRAFRLQGHWPDLPDAIRAFEGRRFVVVREGERERRVTVKTGIETDDKVEILDGLKAGDVVVGQ